METEGWDATIKVDYDTARNPLLVRRIVSVLAELEVVRLKVYRTRKGYHLRVWLSPGRVCPCVLSRQTTACVRCGGQGTLPMSARKILRLQAALGDDPMRQRFNARRVRRAKAGWNVLWNSKYKNGRCVMHEEVDVGLTTMIGEKVCRGWDFWRR